MPRIGEMFPSKWLHAEDLNPGVTVVTIAQVYAEEAKRNRQTHTLDTKWIIVFRELGE